MNFLPKAKNYNYGELYNYYVQGDRIVEFFGDNRFALDQFVSYEEMMEVVGEDVAESTFPSLRKNLLRIHHEMNNAASDTL